MRKFVVTFYWQNDSNNKISIEIRTKLEQIAPQNWIQIFPNQITIHSNLAISELYENLQPLSEKIRISIFEFSNSFVNESRFENSLDEYNY